jgi:hypothetical protein
MPNFRCPDRSKPSGTVGAAWAGHDVDQKGNTAARRMGGHTHSRPIGDLAAADREAPPGVSQWPTAHYVRSFNPRRYGKSGARIIFANSGGFA